MRKHIAHLLLLMTAGVIAGCQVIPFSQLKLSQDPLATVELSTNTPAPDQRATATAEFRETQIAERTASQKTIEVEKTQNAQKTLVAQQTEEATSLRFETDGWMAIEVGKLKVWNPAAKKYEVAPVTANYVAKIAPGDYEIGVPDSRYATGYEVAYYRGVPVYVLDTQTGKSSRIEDNVAEIPFNVDGITSKTLVWWHTKDEDRNDTTKISVILNFGSIDDLKSAERPSREQLSLYLASPDNFYAKNENGISLPLGFGKINVPVISNSPRDHGAEFLFWGPPVTVPLLGTIPEEFKIEFPEYADAPDKNYIGVYVPIVMGNPNNPEFGYVLIGLEGETDITIRFNLTARRTTSGSYKSYEISAVSLVKAGIFVQGHQVGTAVTYGYTPEELRIDIERMSKERSAEAMALTLKFMIPEYIRWSSLIRYTGDGVYGRCNLVFLTKIIPDYSQLQEIKF